MFKLLSFGLEIFAPPHPRSDSLNNLSAAEKGEMYYTKKDIKSFKAKEISRRLSAGLNADRVLDPNASGLGESYDYDSDEGCNPEPEPLEF